MTAPPAEVEAVFATYPAPARERLLAVRALILQAAAADPAIGPLTETLKWREPAYLTEATGAGSTIRLGWSPKAPGRCAVYLNCKTDLVDRYRALFGGELAFEGNRAILLDLAAPLAEAPLSACLAMALTYHRDKRRAA